MHNYLSYTKLRIISLPYKFSNLKSISIKTHRNLETYKRETNFTIKTYGYIDFYCGEITQFLTNFNQVKKKHKSVPMFVKRLMEQLISVKTFRTINK